MSTETLTNGWMIPLGTNSPPSSGTNPVMVIKTYMVIVRSCLISSTM